MGTCVSQQAPGATICCQMGTDSLVLEDRQSQERFIFRQQKKMFSWQLEFYTPLRKCLFHKGEPCSSGATGKKCCTKCAHWNCKFLKHTGKGADTDSMWVNADLFPNRQRWLGPSLAPYNTIIFFSETGILMFSQRQMFINKLAVHVHCTMTLSWCAHFTL